MKIMHNFLFIYLFVFSNGLIKAMEQELFLTKTSKNENDGQLNFYDIKKLAENILKRYELAGIDSYNTTTIVDNVIGQIDTLLTNPTLSENDKKILISLRDRLSQLIQAFVTQNAIYGERAFQGS